MKKSVLFFLVFLSLVLTSCNEQKLVGSWVYKQTESEGAMQMNVKGTITFENDGTGSERAQCVAQSVEDLDGVSVLVNATFSLMCEFDWSIKGDEIVMSPIDVNIKNVTYKMYDYDTDEYLGELTGSDMNAVLDEIKGDLMQATTEKIIMQQDNKFVTESYEDGKKTTCTYNRVE